jgi:hypothetical protein
MAYHCGITPSQCIIATSPHIKSDLDCPHHPTFVLPLVPPAVPEVGKAAGSTATDDHEAHRNRFGHGLGGSSEKSGQTARENGEKWLDFEDFDMTGKG